MDRLPLLLCLAFFLALPAEAQSGRVIDPGMSRDQVVAELGTPAVERRAGGFIYLFYSNGCERTCGMQDLVILQNGSVVDAIFRAKGRTYTGTSSSPGDVAPGRTDAASGAVRSSLGAGAGRGSIILSTPAPEDTGALAPASIRRAAGAVPDPVAAPGATGTNANPARVEQLRRAPHDSAITTPQTPALGSPVPRDSSYVPGIQLRPGEKPAPFQGARPSPADSARRADQRARQAADTIPRPQE